MLHHDSRDATRESIPRAARCSHHCAARSHWPISHGADGEHGHAHQPQHPQRRERRRVFSQPYDAPGRRSPEPSYHRTPRTSFAPARARRRCARLHSVRALRRLPRGQRRDASEGPAEPRNTPVPERGNDARGLRSLRGLVVHWLRGRVAMGCGGHPGRNGLPTASHSSAPPQPRCGLSPRPSAGQCLSLRASDSACCGALPSRGPTPPTPRTDGRRDTGRHTAAARVEGASVQRRRTDPRGERGCGRTRRRGCGRGSGRVRCGRTPTRPVPRGAPCVEPPRRGRADHRRTEPAMRHRRRLLRRRGRALRWRTGSSSEDTSSGRARGVGSRKHCASLVRVRCARGFGVHSICSSPFVPVVTGDEHPQSSRPRAR